MMKNELNILLQSQVAASAVERLATVGLSTMYVMMGRDYGNEEGTGLQVDLNVDSNTLEGDYLFDKGREAKVNEFLELYDDVTVTRESRYNYKPKMKVSWVDRGVRVEVDFGTGVCERKQVGTKKVESFDPEQLAALTRITVEEPVYEYFCVDPILN